MPAGGDLFVQTNNVTIGKDHHILYKANLRSLSVLPSTGCWLETAKCSRPGLRGYPSAGYRYDNIWKDGIESRLASETGSIV
jgi:hypothetical protein